jgi:hypothetical protein
MGVGRTMNVPANDRASAYLRTLIIVSGVLVAATVVLRFGKGLFLAPLNLTNENVAAAWFSGMLLLLASLHAADGFFRLRRTNIRTALAWCVISGMLLALSADEIGSLHERIDDTLKMGPWLSYLPFLIVLLGACAWSFIQLWITPSERSRVPGLIIGFGILISVGGQEYIEKAFRWPWYLGPLRSGFEEGSELVGMMILIKTMLPNSTGLFTYARRIHAPAFSSIYALRWFIVAGAAIIAWPVSIMSASLDLQAVDGHLSDWLACALFALSAVLVLDHWIQSSHDTRAFPTAGIFWLCAASVLCVQIDPISDDSVFPFSRPLEIVGLQLGPRLLLLALCCLGAAESLRARGSAYRTSVIMLAFAGVLSASLAACAPLESLRWVYFATTMVGLITFSTLAYGLQTERSESRAADRYEQAPVSDPG